MNMIETWRGRLQALVLAAAAVAVVGVVTVAARQDPQGPGRPGEPGMRARMPFAQLNLTDEQKTQLRSLREKHREADQATFEQLRAGRELLRKAIFASATPDQAQIESLTNQVADLEAKALRARVARELEMASILTDEQRQKAATVPSRPSGPRRGPRK